MGRLLSQQDSSPLERSDFTLTELEEADEARVRGEGWVEIESVVHTDKGVVVAWTFTSEKTGMELENTAAADEISRLR